MRSRTESNFVLCLLALFILAMGGLFDDARAITTGNSFHFQAAVGCSLQCAATTSASYEQFSSGSCANQPDIIIRNIGTTPVYFEIGLGGATSPIAGVPTTSAYGSQVINPGEADLLSKAQADTVSCVTSTSTGTLVITPGVGN